MCMVSFTRHAGAPSHRPKHSSSTSVNLPSLVVSPTSMPSRSLQACVIFLWSHTSHEIERHTATTLAPLGCR